MNIKTFDLLIIGTYFLMVIFTYGAALDNICHDTKNEKLDCLVGAAMSGAPIAAMAWPFYWSYKLQEQK